jgi:hypothetical protein
MLHIFHGNHGINQSINLNVCLLGSTSVYNSGTAESNYFTCNGQEQCIDNHCQCPYNGLDRYGYWSMQTPGTYASDPALNVSLGWSTQKLCEATPEMGSPGAVAFFQWQGIIIDGAFLLCCLTALLRLWKSGRLHRNLQTYAIILLTLEGIFYFSHVSDTLIRRSSIHSFT